MEEIVTWQKALVLSIKHLFAIILLVFPLVYTEQLHPLLGSGPFQPFTRGFFCDDQNLKHPFIENQTVPRLHLCIIWSVLIFVTVTIVEVILECFSPNNTDTKHRTFSRLPARLYGTILCCVTGAFITLLITFVSKFSVGRLRPHFFSLCPPAGYISSCIDRYNYSRFVVINETSCWGNASSDALREGRMSFISGHSSLSFYAATFLVVYLKSRLLNINFRAARLIKTVRTFVQYGVILLAFWISLTRVADYYCHAGDVIAGAITGMVVAGLIIYFVGGFSDPSWSRVELKREDERSFQYDLSLLDRLNIKQIN